IHHSQQLIEKLPHGIVVSLEVQLNFELEREILGFGDRVRVIRPEKLKRKIKEKLAHAIDLYETELDASGIKTSLLKAEHKGSAVMQHVYTRKEVNRMKTLIQEYFTKNANEMNQQVYAVRQLLTEIPELKEILLNSNLQKILSRAGENLFISKAI